MGDVRWTAVRWSLRRGFDAKAKRIVPTLKEKLTPVSAQSISRFISATAK